MKNQLKKINLTSGIPWKQVLIFALPLLLSTALNDLYSFVDNFVLGKFAPEYFSGVSSALPVINLFTIFLNGFTIGFSSFTGKYFGAKDDQNVHLSFIKSIMLTVFIEIIVLLVAILLLDPLLGLVNIFKDIDPILYEAAYYKGLISLLTAFVTSISLAIINQLRSIGDGFSPLLFTIVGNVLNIIGDIVVAFIMPTHFLKLLGILLATSVSSIFSLLFIIIYISKKYPQFRFKFYEIKEALKGSFEYIINSLPVALQWSMIFIGFITLQGTFVNFDNIISIRNGAITHDVVNAKSAAGQIITYITTIFASLGSAMLAYTSQNYGAKNYYRIKQGTRQFVVMSLIIYLAVNFFTFIIVYNGTGLYLFLDPEYVNSNAIWYFAIYYLINVGLLFLNSILIVYRSVLQGLQKTLFPLLGSIGELAARIIVTKAVMPLVNSTDQASRESFIVASFCDPCAWILCLSILLIGAILYIYSKKSKHSVSYLLLQEENASSNRK